MKECPVCLRCYPDQINHCPSDGDLLRFSITGDIVLDGRYQLDRRLGQGGMGAVFKARHIFLKTQHAIKVILPDLVGNDPTLVTRFRQEAMAAAAIRHPNIIAVTDFGVVNGTTPFLVMEFVEGRSLHDILGEEGRLAPQRALDIISGIAAGLSAAHRQGIVHRDLKPLNVMLRNDAESVNESVKLLDFGLAKIKSTDLLGSFVAVQTTGLMGSPFYMAPEQWSDEEPDARSDIYSLGIILYQMLAGEVPFKGGSIPSIMSKHLTSPPPSLASRGVSVSPAVEAAVRHALEKEPANRPHSVEAFVAELREAVHAANAETARLPEPLPAPTGFDTISIAPHAPQTAHDGDDAGRPFAEAISGQEVGDVTAATNEVEGATGSVESATGRIEDDTGAIEGGSLIEGRAVTHVRDASPREPEAPAEAVGADTREAFQETGELTGTGSLEEPPTSQEPRIFQEPRAFQDPQILQEPRAAEPRDLEEARGFEAQTEEQGASDVRSEVLEEGAREVAPVGRQVAPAEPASAPVVPQVAPVEPRATTGDEASPDNEEASLPEVESGEFDIFDSSAEIGERTRIAPQAHAEAAQASVLADEETRLRLAQHLGMDAHAGATRQTTSVAETGNARQREAAQASPAFAAPASETNAPRAGAPAAPVNSASRVLAIALLLVVLAGAGMGSAYYFWLKKGAPNSSANAADSTRANALAGEAQQAGNGPARRSQPDFIELPGGPFSIGRKDVPPLNGSHSVAYLTHIYSQWPAHEVNIAPFAIDRTEVTHAEYAEFIKATGHAPPAYWNEGGSQPAGDEREPVRSVSFEDAQAFAAWRSQRDGVQYRLPTEEEWEYAARGGDASRLFPWGAEWAEGRANINFQSVKPVGSFPQGQTPQGVQDMIGNVWEWTSSEASIYKGNNRMKLPSQDAGKAVIRGGSYESKATGDEPISATARRFISKDTKDEHLGFRLVRAGK